MSNGTLNEITLIGRLTADPRKRSFESGDIAVSFSLATSETWKDRDDAKRERTQFHNVNILNQGLAKVANEYLKKGSLACVKGAMEYREFEKDGVKQRAAEVVLRPFAGELLLLSPKL